MFEKVPFIAWEGKNNRPDLTLMALSTCGFCKKGMAFLQEREISYRYVFLDQVDPELKTSAKEEFQTLFGKPLSYPTLIVDGKETIIGFIREVWDEKLGSRS